MACLRNPRYWHDLDFSGINASRLLDSDLKRLLSRVDAVRHLRRLSLAGCTRLGTESCDAIWWKDHGLNPLRYSTSLETINLRLFTGKQLVNSADQPSTATMMQWTSGACFILGTMLRSQGRLRTIMVMQENRPRWEEMHGYDPLSIPMPWRCLMGSLYSARQLRAVRSAARCSWCDVLLGSPAAVAPVSFHHPLSPFRLPCTLCLRTSCFEQRASAVSMRMCELTQDPTTPRCPPVMECHLCGEPFCAECSGDDCRAAHLGRLRSPRRALPMPTASAPDLAACTMHPSATTANVAIASCGTCKLSFCAVCCRMHTCSSCTLCFCDECDPTTRCGCCGRTYCHACVALRPCDLCERDSCAGCCGTRVCDVCELPYCEDCRKVEECEGCGGQFCTACVPLTLSTTHTVPLYTPALDADSSQGCGAVKSGDIGQDMQLAPGSLKTTSAGNDSMLMLCVDCNVLPTPQACSLPM